MVADQGEVEGVSFPGVIDLNAVDAFDPEGLPFGGDP